MNNMNRLKTISQKSIYGLKAIFELAYRNTPEPVKIQDIASSQGIPPRFLEIILAELKHAGLVDSRRGNDGGYILTRLPDKITVGEVIAALQGFASTTVENHSPNETYRGDASFAKMWNAVNIVIASIYNNTTFSDLIAQEMASAQGYTLNYAI